MAARILDGQALAARIRQQLVPKVASFVTAHGRPPGLGIALVGDDPASEVYIRNKLRAAAEIGLRADLERLPATASLGEVLGLVERLNGSAFHDGVLVQAPLPRALGPHAIERVFDAITPGKDVDGCVPTNVGLLVQNRATLVSCTPSGILELLDSEGVSIAGRHAVVVGRSDIVGKPLALLLLHRHATVTVCHSRTADLARVCQQADILVAAVGRAGLVTPAFVKAGAAVIDVGVNRVTDAGLVSTLFPAEHPRRSLFEQKGSLLVGDVHPDVASVAGFLTPVPGGVGPLTIAMLLRNTLLAATARAEAGTRDSISGLTV